MPVFETKTELIDFLEYITERFKTNLSEGAIYNLNLDLAALSKGDMDEIVNTFRDFANKNTKLVQPVNGVMTKK